MTRILVLILCAMMVLGSFAMVIYYGFASKEAADATPAASAVLFEKDQQMRVGLAYNSSAKATTALTASGGFSFGYIKSGKEYVELWQVADDTLSVACDFHLKGSGSSYSLGSESNATVGGYRICLKTSDKNCFSEIEKINEGLKDKSIFSSADDVPSGVDYYAYPGMIDGKYAIFVGDFAKTGSASSAMAPLKDAYPDAFVQSPRQDGVIAVSKDGRVLYCYASSQSPSTYFATRPNKNSETITYASNIYKGVFEFRRVTYNSESRMQIVNVLPLEPYVEGVLTYEISRSWPVEAQKAFAVTVRNYALTHLDAHKSYDFHVCTTTCCEVYKGCTKVNQTVIDCVAATKGLICLYDGDIMLQWYSSSVGGTTVDVSDAWGGRKYPYLESIVTPWEKYESHDNGSWTKQYSPSKLAQTLRDAGYSSIKGDVSSVVINSFSKNSTYVTSLTIKDTKGNQITLKTSDRIRIALGLYSANFVVGKAGSTVTVKDYGLKGYGDFETGLEEFPPIHIATGNGNRIITAASPLYAHTKDGKKLLDAAPSLWLRNTTSTNRFTSWVDGLTLPLTKKTRLLDFNQLDIVSKDRQIKLSGTSGNFVFVGRGWGHGVGASQYGYYDLAKMGYSWDEIIGFYYEYSNLVDYTTLVQ